MKGSMKLFKIFGIDIKLHFSWWLVFILIAWMLSASFFPQFFPGQTQVMYWTMGITASLLLFVSVLLHELSHFLYAICATMKFRFGSESGRRHYV